MQAQPYQCKKDKDMAACPEETHQQPYQAISSDPIEVDTSTATTAAALTADRHKYNSIACDMVNYRHNSGHHHQSRKHVRLMVLDGSSWRTEQRLILQKRSDHDVFHWY